LSADAEPQPARPRKPRKPSAQESFFAWASERRLGEIGLPDQGWGHGRINKEFSFVKELDGETLTRAFDLFLDDTHKQGLSPPCPMWAFARDWARYVDLARREGRAVG
jgi:hypothetical protein